MQITGELVTFFLMVIGALAGAWWRVFGQIQAAEERAGRRAAEAEEASIRTARELTNFRIEVAQRYASVEHLREVEVRLVTAVDRLSDRMDTMPDRLARIVGDALGQRKAMG